MLGVEAMDAPQLNLLDVTIHSTETFPVSNSDQIPKFQLVPARALEGLFSEGHLLGGLDGGEVKHTQFMEVVFVDSKRSL
jgi:hypothetical protein